MDAEQLARLRRNLAAATDDALVALANRGLVRRAQKDLQQAEALIVETIDGALLVRGDTWTVTMPPAGPSAATDDTPATGVTRQIITATLYLRDHWQPGDAGSPPPGKAIAAEEANVATSAAAEDEPLQAEIAAAAQRLIEASPAELFKWAGKTPVLEASAALATAGTATVSYAPQLAIEFPDAGVRVLLMTDRPATSVRRLLEQFKTTANRSAHPRWVILAVLALKRAAGQQTAIDSDAGAGLTEAIRDDRQRTSRHALRLLAAVANAGVAHPSSRIVERLRTAGVAAEAARFPRLARLLTSIADDAQLQIARAASADPARMRQRMVVAHALATAGSRSENAPRSDLFGRARSTYLPTGEMRLSGLGAYGWRTASGFEGLTTIFWEANARQFVTASLTRGEGQDRTFSIPQAYAYGLGWSGGSAVQAMCRRQLTLHDAKSNVEGRLSLSESCRVVLDAPTDAGSIDFGDRAISHWSDLPEVAQGSQPLGLRLPDPRRAFVVIQPAQWGDRWFDELDQAFVWQLHDTSGAPLHVRIPWTEVDEASVLFFESLKVERDHPTAILGRLEVGERSRHVYPFAIFSSGTARGDKILCPQFDQIRIQSRNDGLLRRLRKKYKREPLVATRIGEPEMDELDGTTADDLLNAPLALRSLVLDLDGILSAALEAGTSSLNPAAAETLAVCRDRLQSLGVAPLANALAALLTGNHEPGDILSAAYRLHLFRQSLRLVHVA